MRSHFFFEEITSGSRQDQLQELTDYRSYLNFDIIITDDQGHKSYFSKVSRTESGGGAQIPFYVAILASFYQVYHLYRKKEDTLRLVVFDEAFNRMDADNVEECMRFIRKLGFQVLIVEPTGKIQLGSTLCQYQYNCDAGRLQQFRRACNLQGD